MLFLNANLEEGFVILLVGMLIVFMALVLLFCFFTLLPKVLNLFVKKPKPAPKPTTSETSTKSYVSGEQMAAVSAAVYLFLEEAHDQENAIVTINSVAKNYSPWSSKIYVTHQFNNR
ncbi:sodium pump decarboxylases, gamma subunit [Pustulibacterium marinum]|uniref:Sodium pump decarboxylases, gamma subunit n=1 Tax=Pustulibacterium marinum TaxID=1224947 RepID=A0A1I7ISW2_9FLAO|nr:OadG family protein [Pustulibacterium marinum]SFU76026.1 sodium pump decarboxylases, gamma subunit [Pustulibacterium marinum]